MTEENKGNNWLNVIVAVAIAVVALLGSFITKAQSETGSAAALAGNREQEKYYQAIGRQISGEADVNHAFGTEYQLWYRYNIQLASAAQRADQEAVIVFTGLRDAVEKNSNSQIFSAEYFDKKTAKLNLERYKADLYIQDLYLLQEEQQAASEEAAAWWEKNGIYGLQLTLLVVAGFLLGLALMTRARIPTFVFTTSGLVSVVVIGVWAYLVGVQPVMARPTEALKAFAEGASLGDQARWDEALPRFNAAIELAEAAGVDYPRAHLHRAKVYVALGKFPEAILDYQAAKETGLVDDPTLNSSLISAYFQLGDFKNALEVGQSALKASPDNLMLHQQLAAVYLASGDITQATQMNNSLLAKAVVFHDAQKRLGDNTSEVWWLLGNAAHQYDLFIEAMQGQNAISANVKDKEAARKAAVEFTSSLRALLLRLKYEIPTVNTATATARIGDPKFIIESTADKKFTYKVGLRFQYKDLQAGQILSIVVYRNQVEELAWAFSQPWDGSQTEGVFNLTISPSYDRFYIVPSGNYLVHIYVNDKLASQGEFAVNAPDGLPGPTLMGALCDPLDPDPLDPACSGETLALTDLPDWSDWPEWSPEEELYYDCLFYPDGPFCQFVPEADSDGDTVPDYYDVCPYEYGSWYDYGCPPNSTGDADGDGLSNFDDYCPLLFGFIENYGCPIPSETDWDGDGIQDIDDICPVDAGPIENGGCPIVIADSDGDYIPDDMDFCPQQYGLGADGCPVPTEDDMDGDGVLDVDDLCADQPGPIENGGCPISVPDSDADTIPDDFDACPQQYGLGADGCPVPTEDDMDGDGVLDAEDICPDQPGPVELGGCPVTALDSDADTIPDDFDACPQQYGLGEDGCPVPTADDTDGDGVLDVDDACIDQPGPAANSGCPETSDPDTDGDGTPDASDDCPEAFGPAENFGCPVGDIDGDGLMDDIDACPYDYSTEPDGCPLDSDGDGYYDPYDSCPYEYGTDPYGCPVDSDGDGLTDDVDTCPGEPGPLDTNGCPDADGDGVPDYADSCPDLPGVPENSGCPLGLSLSEPATPPYSATATYPLLMSMTLGLAFLLARRI